MMALNGSALKTLVISNLQSELGSTFTAKQIEQITPLCLAIANAVVEHIQTAAVVSATAPLGVAVLTAPATGIGATTAPVVSTGSVT
jgi:hypothetical protein